MNGENSAEKSEGKEPEFPPMIYLREGGCLVVIGVALALFFGGPLLVLALVIANGR